MSRLLLPRAENITNQQGNVWTTTAGDKTQTVNAISGYGAVAVHAATGATTQTNSMSDNNTGGTWTVQVTATYNGGAAANIKISVRDNILANANSTIFTATQTSSTGGGFDLLYLRDYGMIGLAGSNAVRATGFTENGTAGTTPSVTLSAAPRVEDLVIAAVFNQTSPATLTPPTAANGSIYGETADLGYSTPTSGLQVCRCDGGETNTTINWGSTSASQWSAVAIVLFGYRPFIARGDGGVDEYGSLGSVILGA